MFKLLQAALMAALLVMVGLAVPASATVSTSTDLVVRIRVRDLTTGVTTVAHPYDRVKFAVVVTNLGPDEAAFMNVPIDPASSNFSAGQGSGCILNVYSHVGPQYLDCGFENVPAGTKFTAVKAVNFAPNEGSMYGTFCIRIDNNPDQVDPNPANDCQTASIPIVP